ncbi:hypothetical protein LA080_008070 [Diaporthe eres]|nr:hypothetical protein LA080_008070 [Diaporthe eres]
MSADAVAPELKAFGHTSTEVGQNSSGQSYVDKHREAQKVHSKTHPGDISSLLQPQPSRGSQMVKKSLFRGRHDSDHPRRRRHLIRKKLAPRRQPETDSSNEPAFFLQNENSLATPPNWPFGVTPTSSRNDVNQRAQHHPLTQREIRLLLGNPLIRDGNMGPLPIPDAVRSPRPPPHVYDTIPGPEINGIWSPPTIPRLTGLKRRNAQRRSSNPALQQKFESYNDRFNSRFRRGSAARDVHVDYSSPFEIAEHKLAGNKFPMYQIEEASHEPPDSESTQKSTSGKPDVPTDHSGGEILFEHCQHLEGEAGVPQKVEGPQRFPQTTEEQDAPSGQRTQHQNDGNETPSTSARIHPSPRRYPHVVKGPRPAPTSLSTSSSAPSTPPSSTPPTAATQASTATSESASEPKSEHLARVDHECVTAGCTWKDCSRIRGTFRMPLPGAVGESKPENGGGSSAAETRSEDDIVSVGNGFSFLRLN